MEPHARGGCCTCSHPNVAHFRKTAEVPLKQTEGQWRFLTRIGRA
jgi:hypothetical protein